MRRGSPGRRFQRAYENARRRRRSTPLWFRLFRFILALVAFALGVVFAVIPGPAFVFFILSGALLAQESRFMAMALDWTELRVRAVLRWGKRRWKRMGWIGRILVLIIGAAVSAGLAVATWLLMAG